MLRTNIFFENVKRSGFFSQISKSGQDVINVRSKWGPHKVTVLLDMKKFLYFLIYHFFPPCHLILESCDKRFTLQYR
ncbi:MAG: hypothetical protein EOO34_00420 [Cyanobacteriota bacterium]|nr:MAG: hypothetical protein EOO34_00420 [Cyanobacteriota bacterium]